MTKLILRKGLAGLPENDIEERLIFYSEMIEDRIEEGFSEEESVAAAGSVDEIIAQTIADIPLSKIAGERIRTKRQLKSWEIALLALGSPIWLSLGIAAAAVFFAVYVSAWSVIASLWAVFGSLAVCAVVGTAECIAFAAGGSGAAGIAVLSVGIICAGLAVFMFLGCRAATNGAVTLTKKFSMRIKNRFIRREAA